MAKKQTRGSVSLNRKIYDEAKREANRRGQTLAAFVEAALIAAGIPTVEHPQQPLAVARANARARRNAAQTKATRQPQPRSSPARQMLGDGVANAMGIV